MVLWNKAGSGLYNCIWINAHFLYVIAYYKFMGN